MDNLFYIAGRFKLLYRISPGRWLLIMAGFLAFWIVLMLLLCRGFPMEQSRNLALLRSSLDGSRFAFALNMILMLLGLVIILLVTFVRRKSSENQVILIPMRVLFGLRAPGDYWDVTVMNVVLYVPFACGLCFVMGKKYTHPARLTILICFILSFTAEVLQYIFDSGWTEVDDVLMNTFGGVLGTLPFLATTKLKNR